MKSPTILKKILFAASVMAALSSCGQQTFDVVHTQDQSGVAGTQSIAPKIDIVLAVDNSGSTIGIQNQLNASIRTFLAELNAQNWDFRVTAVPLIGTPGLSKISASKYDANYPQWVQPYPDAPKTSTIPSGYYTQPEYYSVTVNSVSTDGKEYGLKNVGTFLNLSETKAYFIRPEAALAVVILSNGDDSSDGVDYSAYPYLPYPTVSSGILSSIQNAKGGSLTDTVHLFPVVSSQARSSCYGESAWKGTRYMSAGWSVGGHGVIDICSNSMSAVLTQLKSQMQAITLNFTKRYVQIAKAPNEDTIKVTKTSRNKEGQVIGVISVPKSVNGSAGWRYIGYTTVPMISKPVNMDYRTGYTIELIGEAYELVGNDTATVDYLEYGATPSK